jgi:hypothetical protein
MSKVPYHLNDLCVLQVYYSRIVVLLSHPPYFAYLPT